MTTETHFENGILTVTRRYAYPRAQVFAAWTEAERTQHWWGCKNTTHVASTIDAKLGGTYQHEMTIRDVGVHPIIGKLAAYDPPAHLAYDMPGMSPDSPMRVDVRFHETKGGTKVVLTQHALPDAFKEVVSGGWAASFDRLDRYFTGERRAA